MVQNAWPYETQSVEESEWRSMGRLWRRTGVVADVDGELAVTEVTGALQVDVAAGEAWVDGHYYSNGAVERLDLDAADLNDDRIDLIVVRSTAGSGAELVVLTGTPAADPDAPVPTQDHEGAGVYEEPLAEVRVVAAASNVDGQVTDRRTFSTPHGALLDDLSDVDAEAPADGDGVFFDEASGLWIADAGIPAGLVSPFAGSSAPDGWLICNGAAVSRSTYSALYDVVGTTYGAGDGSTTFNLPDLRDRFPVGTGSLYSEGDTGGLDSVTLTESQMPAHDHTLQVSEGDNSMAHNTASDVAAGIGSNFEYHGPILDAGGGAAHENRPPYIGLNFIIKT